MDGTRRILKSMDFRLTYADCDPAGIVYFAAYYPWFERTYNEWILGQDKDPGRMLADWGATNISRASSCEYFIPGVLFDPLRCDMRVQEIGTTSFTLVFDFCHRRTDDVIARGTMVFVFIDPDRKLVPVPDEMLALLGTG